MSFAEEYADMVISGQLVAGKKIIQAVTRFKEDLKRQNTKEFPYYFDEKIEKKIISFIELLPQTDGKELKLAMFQKWLVSELYSWREVGTGNKRYNRAFISMARKNSKTYIASIMGVIALLMEDEPSKARQVLFTSNAYKQAKLGFQMMSSELRAIAKKSPYIRKRLEINKAQITDLDTESFAMALSSDTSTLDGYGATLGIVDEFHKAKNRDVLNAIKSGMNNQKNGLLAVVSTSGESINCPMYEDYLFLSEVLAGREVADRYFIAIWEIDSEDKETLLDHEEVWIKANPLFEIEEVRRTMTSTIKDDLELGIKQENVAPVLVKNFNTWENAKTNQFMTVEDWKNAQVDVTPNISGKSVYIGVDLSKTGDLSSVSWLVPLDDKKFYIDSFSFVGTKGGIDRKERRDNISYRKLEKLRECDITTLDSGIIDYTRIVEFIDNLIEKNDFKLQAICYDPYNANSLITDLEKKGYPMIEIRQGAITLSVPIREFKEQLFNGKIIHANNRLLTYAVNNAVMRYDNQNNALIDKTKYETRIDPLVALIDAWVIGKNYYTEVDNAQADNEFYTSDNFGF
ncbi:terminase large subunit [Dellaglioa algida]|uniref:terminase large subunit n=1 Tax=Dellaglioa algida TaxID=105612 RepID=UPI0024DE7B0A|nr:terminase TerL endonuclease subunit [Dellaglioa algida]MDK1740085.1 terminase large subunit [Dellaglioa algida]